MTPSASRSRCRIGAAVSPRRIAGSCIQSRTFSSAFAGFDAGPCRPGGSIFRLGHAWLVARGIEVLRSARSVPPSTHRAPAVLPVLSSWKLRIAGNVAAADAANQLVAVGDEQLGQRRLTEQ